MRISITTDTELYPIEVSDDLELENFKALCEVEVGIPANEMMIMFNAQHLTDNKKTLKDYGVKDGELIMVVRGTAATRRAAERLQQAQQPTEPMDIAGFDFGSIRLPGDDSVNISGVPSGQDGGAPQASGSQDDPAVIRDMLLANPEQVALLKHNNPKLGEALTSGDQDRFASVLKEQQETRRERERQRIRLLSADPFDMEAQQLIANEIAQENINANMEAAIEFNPESFGTVHMLYINCKVNGYDVKAFIDSGAQTTLMSQACAERCNIMRLVDTRWAGIAKGVGTQKIIGRVHMGQIQIEGDFLASSFSILEKQSMDMLLGLDMLKRHQMCISLKDNTLLIGTTGTSTPFLPESELPECARLTNLSEEEIKKESEQTARMSEDQALAEALSVSAKEAEPSSSQSSKGRNVPNVTPIPAASIDQLMPEDKFTESDVREIINIGFTRAEAVKELRQQSGNKTQAIAALFAKSFKL